MIHVYMEAFPSPTRINNDSEPRLRQGVQVEEAWKLQREVADQWKKVGRLQVLAGRLKEEPKDDLTQRTQDIRNRLANDLRKAEDQLARLMNSLRDLYDLPGERPQKPSGTSSVLDEIEQELNSGSPR